MPVNGDVGLGNLMERFGMAFDDDRAVYVLTPEGWMPGDEHPEAVEMWERSTSQASGWSREYVSWSCHWANPKVSRGERDRLRAHYQEFFGKPGRSGNREITIGRPL